MPAQRVRVADVVNFLHPPADHGRKSSDDLVLKAWQQTASLGHKTFEQLTVRDLVGERTLPGYRKV